MKTICLFVSLLISLPAFSQVEPGRDTTLPWFHTTTIYQVYPRSFYDSNGDGTGDIQGIIQKLDYIKSLGFESVWFSPFYQSPQQDFGYDISDYQNIAPEYGSMADAQQLINEVHKRGMKIVFDMVMNHTSDQHPWFRESLTSRTNPKADWYIWRDKPNNWKSMTGGSGWHYCPERKQYYWASFLPFQPDLNYRNPEVKSKMLDVIRFWLQKGVDGYRLDIFNVIYKDSLFRDNPFKLKALPGETDPSGFFQEAKYTVNQPESMEFAKQLRTVCKQFGDKLLIGEVFGDRKTIRKFSGSEKNDGLGLVFDFEMLQFKFSAAYFKQLITNLEKDFPYPFMPVYVFSNHDKRRSMTRLDGNMSKAKLLQLLQLTVRGVPCIYNGEEIGMRDGHLAFSTALDPIGRKYKAVPHFIADMAGQTLNRDEVRTPMQWNDSANAGFSTASKTWLPLNADFKKINVAAELNDDCSLLYQLRELLKLRNAEETLHEGSLQLIEPTTLPEGVLAYKRILGKKEVLVLLNFSKGQKQFELDGSWLKLFSINRQDGFENGKILLNTYGGIVNSKIGMMKKIKILICLLAPVLLAAQDNVVLRGFVLDGGNHQPLSLCAVQIGQSALGALTDDNGFFDLPIPKTNLKDSLRISFVGYEPQTLAISGFKQGDTLRISLQPQVLMKQEAVITAMNAKGVLLRAIENLRKNLYRDSIIQTGFYRQMHKENGKYVRLIEADVDVALNIKNPATYSFHEMIHVNQQRRSENYETNGDIHGDHFVDLLKENPFSYNKSTFLNPKMLEFFAPKFDSEDSVQYVIKTQYKESSSAKLEQAKIWVEKETFAITRIEIEKYPNPYYIPTRYAIDSRWKLVNEKDVITLTKYQGKFVVSSLQRVYNHHVLNRQTGQVDFIVEESFDLFFYSYQSNNVGRTLQSGKFGIFTSFYSSHYNYNQGFWKNYDMPFKHELPAQVKTDLQHSISLEKQFEDAGK